MRSHMDDCVLDCFVCFFRPNNLNKMHFVIFYLDSLWRAKRKKHMTLLKKVFLYQLNMMQLWCFGFTTLSQQKNPG